MREEFPEWKHILNSSQEDFWDRLKKAIDEVKPQLFFDYIGGELPAKIFEMMPLESDLNIAGNLTLSPVPINTLNVVTMDKTMSSFHLYRWLKTLKDRTEFDKMVATDLKEGGKIFGQPVVKIMKLTDWRQALEEAPVIATEGKILIDCS